MLKIYACGGTGINVARQLKDLDIDICYIDGSDSNTKGLENSVFLIPGQEGAGKDRTVTYENFKEISGDVLIRFKPSNTLNVVLSSLSGGSGSVIAPLVTRHLIEGGHNTIVIGIDSRTSTREIENSLKSLLTYRGVSSSLGKSVAVFYIENSSRRETDQTAIRFINLLSLLVDTNKTEEFDRADLRNFIQYERVTDNRPSVTILEVGPNQPVTPESGTVVVSSLLMTSNREATVYPVIPDYLATCIINDRNFDLDDIRIDAVLGKLSIITDEFEAQLQKSAENKKINKFKEVEVKSAAGDGMVL